MVEHAHRPDPREVTHAVWTGTEAVFLGVGTDASSWRGEAFNPATDTLRVIAPPPFEYSPAGRHLDRNRHHRMGRGNRGDPSNVSGASYDPFADSWRSIADAPIGLNAASGIWTGAEMLVFGSLLDGGNHAATPNAVGEIYDPVSDSRREDGSLESVPSGFAPPCGSAIGWSRTTTAGMQRSTT